MPPTTMDAFREHGRPRPSLEAELEVAFAVMDSLASAGISLDEVRSRAGEAAPQFADLVRKHAS